MEIINIVKERPKVEYYQGALFDPEDDDFEIVGADEIIEEYFDDAEAVKYDPSGNPELHTGLSGSGNSYIRYAYNGEYKQALNRIKTDIHIQNMKDSLS